MAKVTENENLKIVLAPLFSFDRLCELESRIKSSINPNPSYKKPERTILRSKGRGHWTDRARLRESWVDLRKPTTK